MSGFRSRSWPNAFLPKAKVVILKPVVGKDGHGPWTRAVIGICTCPPKDKNNCVKFILYVDMCTYKKKHNATCTYVHIFI